MGRLCKDFGWSFKIELSDGAGSRGNRVPTFYLFRMWFVVCIIAWKLRVVITLLVPVYSFAGIH